MDNPEVLARQANEVLSHESYQLHMEKARAKILEEWKLATTTVDRESCWYRYHAVGDVDRELRITVTRGREIS